MGLSPMQKLGHAMGLIRDAGDALRALEAENRKLEEENAKLAKERDEALDMASCTSCAVMGDSADLSCPDCENSAATRERSYWQGHADKTREQKSAMARRYLTLRRKVDALCQGLRVRRVLEEWRALRPLTEQIEKLLAEEDKLD